MKLRLEERERAQEVKKRRKGMERTEKRKRKRKRGKGWLARLVTTVHHPRALRRAMKEIEDLVQSKTKSINGVWPMEAERQQLKIMI